MGLTFSWEAKKKQKRDCDDCRQGKEDRLRKVGAAFQRVLREGPVRRFLSGGLKEVQT